MRSQDELFAQFQREFDKIRQSAFISLLWNFPLWMFMNAAAGFFLILFICPSFLGVEFSDHRGTIFVSSVIILVAALINLCFLSDFFAKYSTKKLLKDKLSYLQKKTELRNENWGFRDIITVPNIRPFKCVYDEKSITIWIMLSRRYGVDHDFQVLAKIDDEISKQCDEIQETEVWIQVYKHANEKNFWQYLRSAKWHKKIK